jgi:hypothetical protein
VASEKKRIGERDILEVPLVDAGAVAVVAVVADRFSTAKQARDRLKVDWDPSGLQPADSSLLWAVQGAGWHRR